MGSEEEALAKALQDSKAETLKARAEIKKLSTYLQYSKMRARAAVAQKGKIQNDENGIMCICNRMPLAAQATWDQIVQHSVDVDHRLKVYRVFEDVLDVCKCSKCNKVRNPYAARKNCCLPVASAGP
jgi:hypothetical protein